MKWSFWIELYIRTHCVARGLRPLTLSAYEDALKQFHEWVRVLRDDLAPDQITARDVLAYVQHLREVRGNGDSSVNRAVVILRRFYCAMVAMGYLDHTANPLVGFPSIRAVPRKLPVTLLEDRSSRLLTEPEEDTVIGLRDRALLALLYGTGIRASECSSLCNGQVDLSQLTIRVRGKGGHERVIPLNPQLAEVLRDLRTGSRAGSSDHAFFRSRFGGRSLGRGSIYERAATHLGTTQPCRHHSLASSHEAHLCHALGARRRWPRDHSRSARSSADHQPPDPHLACHRGRSPAPQLHVTPSASCWIP